MRKTERTGLAYRRYGATFRADAIALLERSDRLPGQVARDLGIPEATLRYWYFCHMTKGKKRPAKGKPKPLPVGDPAKETLEAENARLERELAAAERKVRQLEEDRAILKKAAAFFAKESE